MSTAAIPPAVVADAVAAARGFLRIEGTEQSGGEQALLERLAATAILLGEAFTGTLFFARGVEEVVEGAGLAETWDALPAPLAQGVVALIAHLFDDRTGTAQPPASVAALWRPYRRMQLARAEHAA